MAKSRRNAGGATSGRYKPKKMGKGWSAYRPKQGFRPPVKPKQGGDAASAASSASADTAGDADPPTTLPPTTVPPTTVPPTTGKDE